MKDRNNKNDIFSLLNHVWYKTSHNMQLLFW